MYSAGYGFANNGAPSFNNAAPQQPGAQPTGQQVMYNQQQQFAGMAPQGAFAPGANPQMMPGGPAGMMPNAAMPHMAANGQSESPLCALVRSIPARLNAPRSAPCYCIDSAMRLLDRQPLPFLREKVRRGARHGTDARPLCAKHHCHVPLRI